MSTQRPTSRYIEKLNSEHLPSTSTRQATTGRRNALHAARALLSCAARVKSTAILTNRGSTGTANSQALENPASPHRSPTESTANDVYCRATHGAQSQVGRRKARSMQPTCLRRQPKRQDREQQRVELYAEVWQERLKFTLHFIPFVPATVSQPPLPSTGMRTALSSISSPYFPSPPSHAVDHPLSLRGRANSSCSPLPPPPPHARPV